MQENKETFILKLKTNFESKEVTADNVAAQAAVASLKPHDVNTKGWASAEHMAIGNKAFRQALDEYVKEGGNATEIKQLLSQGEEGREERSSVLGVERAEDYSDCLKIWGIAYQEDGITPIQSNNLCLSPGEIIALAGDFYSNPEEPICFGLQEEDRHRRFGSAYNRLANADSAKLYKLCGYFRKDKEEIERLKPEEQDELKTLLAEGEPSELLNSKLKEIKDTLKFTWQTTESSFPCAFWHSLYPNLLLTNFDHFGNEAKIAYKTGHELALIIAKKAQETTAIAKKSKLLSLALTQELFACHYLTDLFAAGHVRTPRKEIFNYLRRADDLNQSVQNISNIDYPLLAIAGLLSFAMHNEDGKNGLMVGTSSDGIIVDETWPAYGDGYYFDSINDINAQKVQALIKNCLKDVLAVYDGSKQIIEVINDFMRYLPQDIKESNPAPLFRVKTPEEAGGMPIVEMRKTKLDDEGRKIKYKEMKKAHLCRFFSVVRKVVGGEETVLEKEAAKEKFEELLTGYRTTSN